MKKVRVAPIILLICLFLSTLSPGARALDDPQIGAKAAILADVDSGRIFFSKNADERVYPASLTKIMTILLAVEAVETDSVKLGDMVTASETSQQGMIPEGSTSNIVPGEVMSLEDLMYCAMLSSANEACNIIAEYVCGSIEDFVGLMNARAAELGCMGTHFANTHGLPDDDHYTTAGDMYLIMAEAVDHDLFEILYSCVTHTVSATNLAQARELSNSNGLINAESTYFHGYFYENAVGGKTGHTSAAGYCLASAASKDDINVLAVVMGGEVVQGSDGSKKYGNFMDSITLYDWVFDNYSIKEILSSSELIANVPVEMAAESTGVAVRPGSVISALIPNDMDVSSFERSYIIYSQRDDVPLVAPITSGAVLGEVSVSNGGVVYGSIPLVAATSVELSKMEYLKHQVDTVLDLVWVKVIFWVLMVCLVIYFLLVFRYRALHKRHLREVYLAKLERAERMAGEETRVFTDTPVPATAARATAAASGPAAQPEPRVPETQSAKPSSDFFTPVPVQERETVKIGSGAISDEEKAKRDYFEEFFNRNNPEK